LDPARVIEPGIAGLHHCRRTVVDIEQHRIVFPGPGLTEHGANIGHPHLHARIIQQVPVERFQVGAVPLHHDGQQFGHHDLHVGAGCGQHALQRETQAQAADQHFGRGGAADAFGRQLAQMNFGGRDGGMHEITAVEPKAVGAIVHVERQAFALGSLGLREFDMWFQACISTAGPD
jgi:hypothetical protein